MEDNLFFYSLLLIRKDLFNSNTIVATNSTDLFNFLIQFAKRTLFFSQLITQIGENLNEDLIVASRGYIWLFTTFLSFFYSKTFSLESSLLLNECLAILTKVFF